MSTLALEPVRLTGKLARRGLASLVVLACVALVATWLTSAEEIDMAILAATPPGAAHPLGTDMIGRDVLARVAEAVVNSLAIGLAVATSWTIVCFAIGSLAAPVLDRARRGTARGTIYVAVAGACALVLLGIADSQIVDGAWPLYLLVVGFDPVSIMFLTAGIWLAIRTARRLEPGQQLVGVARFVPWIMLFVIVQEATLAFLGVGIQPPSATLGNLVSVGQDQTFILMKYWWLFWVPLLAGVVVAAGVVAVGIGLLPRGTLPPERSIRTLARHASLPLGVALMLALATSLVWTVMTVLSLSATPGAAQYLSVAYYVELVLWVGVIGFAFAGSRIASRHGERRWPEARVCAVVVSVLVLAVSGLAEVMPVFDSWA